MVGSVKRKRTKKEKERRKREKKEVGMASTFVGKSGS